MPAIGSGVGASLGIAAESAYGTFTVPTRWTEFETESLELKPHRLQGHGLSGGVLVARKSQRVTPTAMADGQVKTPVFQKGMGLWLAHTLGSAATPVQQAATAAYLQTHNLGSNLGMSLGVQIGRPDLTATVRPYSYLGCKVTDAVFECGVNEMLTGTFTLDAKDVTEAQTLTAPTYLTGNPEFHFGQGVFSMGPFGSEVAVAGVRKFTLNLKRPHKLDNFYLDGTGRKKEPVQNGVFDITGTLETDFIDKTKFVDLFVADTPQSMIVTFTGPLIASTYYYSIAFKIPSVQWDSEGPKVGGPDIIMPKMNFVGLYDDTNPAVTVTYMSTDTTL